MRILRVAHRLFPDDPGGGAYHVHAMSRDQAAMGHDVTVLTVGDSHRRERCDGYTVVTVPTLVAPMGNEIAPGVWRHLRRDGYDVVHAHSHLYVSTNLAAVARRLGGPPLAITNHGLYSQSAPERLFDLYVRTLGRWTYDRADLAFCYTAADRERLRDVGVRASIAVVPNGIDTARFDPDGPELGDVAGDPVVLFVGRLVAGKRPGDAFAAFARMRDAAPTARLVVCDTGPLRADLEARASALGIREAVTFLGRVPYDEIPAVYRAADLLVLPSRAEGLPRTVLEALATGLPAVTSDLPQLRSLVADAGRTVPVGDEDALAAALRDLATDPDRRRRLGANGRERVRAGYDWSDTVDRTTEHLSNIAAE